MLKFIPAPIVMLGGLIVALPMFNPAQAVTVRISEFQSSNGNTLADEDGDYSDWMELHNYGPSPVNLNGFGLSDSPSNPFKWVLPDVTLAPGEYRLVWASDKNRRPGDEDVTNGILREVFSEIYGGAVADLTNHPSFPDNPSTRNRITGLFEAPSDIGDFYGQRMHGWIRPPVSGNYRFYISSDDQSALLLSTNDNPALAREIASVPEWTGSREWDKYAEQESALIPLASNRLYYLSALMKESEYGDNLAVGWRFPGGNFEGPIADSNLFSRGELHTSYGISAGGETLQLTDPATNVIDATPSMAVPRDMSYGRSPANSNVWHFFQAPTPGRANTTQGYPEITAQPLISVPAGMYTSAVTVSVTSTTPEAVVRYTLDGSEPTETSPLFPASITLDSRAGEPNTISEIPTNYEWAGPPNYEGWQPPQGEVFKIHTLRVKSFKTNAFPSRPLTHSYLVDSRGTNRYSLPVISIAADEAHFFDDYTGIYVPGCCNNFMQSGSAWERPGSLEMFEPGGALAFRIEAGIRLHGNTTRNRPRKTLRIYARNPTLIQYQLFPDKPVAAFDTFLLRNGGNDWGQFVFRDDFMQSLVTQTGMDLQYSRPAVVFINGEYWGIHQIRDRFDDGYIENHYGLGVPEFTQLETTNNGSNSFYVHDEGAPDLVSDFANLRAFLNSPGVTQPTNYATVQGWMDVTNFMDHYAAEIYFGNTDWPGNNIRLWRSVATNREPAAPYRHDGRWRWMMYDTDFGFGLNYDYVIGNNEFANFNSLAFAADPNGAYFSNNTNATLMFRRLLANSDFKRDFIVRFSDHLNSSFRTDRVTNHLNALIARVDPEMAEHVERWNQPFNWSSEKTRMRSYAHQRTGAVWGHLRSFFGLGNRSNVTVAVNDNAMGQVRVNTLDITPGLPGVSTSVYPWTGSYFTNYPVTVTAIPRSGHRFVAWRGATQQVVSTSASIAFTPGVHTSLTAQFEAEASIQLIHYWNFNDPLNLLVPSHSVITGASLTVAPGPATVVTNSTGQAFFAENARFGDAAATHFRLNDPLGSTNSYHLPTTGFTNIVIKYETRRSGSGAGLQVIEITTDGTTYQPITNIVVIDGTPILQTLEVSANPAANDNPNFGLRVTFAQGAGGTAGNNRFDNFTVEGWPVPGENLPPAPVAATLMGMIEESSAMVLSGGAFFNDADPLSFTASSSLTNVVSVTVTGSNVTVTPLQRGDSVIALAASDGVNPPVTNAFRVLVYPRAHALSGGDFIFGAWSSNAPARAYPEHMLFLQNDVNDNTLTTALHYAYNIPPADASVPQDADFPYKAASRTRINGLETNGISFINTGRGRDLGGALLALDTRDVGDVPVSWLGGTILTNSRIYAIRLQYRVGTTGPFLDVLDGGNQPVEYVRNAANGHALVIGPVNLPPAALDQPYVHLLWRYYLVSGTSGPRAQLRLDDIQVQRVPPPLVSTYPTMYLRGTFNNWASNTPMTLVADYLWEATGAFTNDPNPRFKFDVYGNWSFNFGDNNADGFAGDNDGSSIPVTGGYGTYRIQFNDQTKAYTSTRLGPFDLWQHDQFTYGERQNESVSGLFADPQGSGVANLYRYATGLDRDDDPGPSLPKAMPGLLGEPVFRYRRLLDPASGVLYTLELNNGQGQDMTWREALPEDGLAVSGTVPTGDGITEDVSVAIPEALIDNALHLRLSVTKE